LVRLRHELYRVRNDLARREGVPHALVPHSDAVADADRAELERDASCQVHALFHELGEVSQMQVTRDNLVPRVGNTNKRAFEIVVC
jgi:hypothetical protein